jgi:hypothetical protein
MESQIIIVFYDNDSNAEGGPYSLITAYKVDILIVQRCK